MQEKLEIELLSHHKEQAHLRLQDHHTPRLWWYTNDWLKEKGELFSYKGYCLYENWYHSIPTDIENVDPGLRQIADWARRAYFNRRSNDGRPGGDLCFRFLRRPDGQWMVCESGGLWVEPDMTKKDEGGRTGYDFQPWQGVGYNRRAWNLNCKFLTLPEEITQLQANFCAAWKESRKQYRKSLRETGESRKRHENLLDEHHVKRTEIRMQVAAQASKVKDMLDVYLKSINDETMTVKQIGELYYELTNLGALNKDLKKVYGPKIPKE